MPREKALPPAKKKSFKLKSKSPFEALEELIDKEVSARVEAFIKNARFELCFYDGPPVVRFMASEHDPDDVDEYARIPLAQMVGEELQWRIKDDSKAPEEIAERELLDNLLQVLSIWLKPPSSRTTS